MFMRYAVARFRDHQRDTAYRIYTSDVLRILTENSAEMYGGSYVQARFCDIIKPKETDGRTGDEIAADVIRRAGLEVTE